MKRIWMYVFILLLPSLFTGCGTTALMSATKDGNLRKMNDLIAQGANVNEVATGFGRFANATPLMVAAKYGRIDAMKLLLDKGAAINAKLDPCYMVGAIDEEGGCTSLVVAAQFGQTEAVKLLINRGADTDIAIDFLQRRTSERDYYKPALIILEKYAKKPELAPAPAEGSSVSTSEQSSSLIKSDIDELPAAVAKARKNSYAIVIGIENYRQKLPRADYAVNDSKLVSEYLSKVMGYPEENIVTLTNEHATKSDFEKYFEKWLGNNVEIGSTVFVYYSGHGAPDPKSGAAYLVPYDGDPSFIDQTGYSLKRMYDALGKLPAKEIVIVLDSCFSGAGGRSVLAEGARPLVMNLQKSFVLSKNMTVLAASSGEQISSTYRDKGHGLFTYFMLKGIKEEDVTRADGSLKMADLFDYIKPQVERIARKQYNNEQTPQLMEGK